MHFKIKAGQDRQSNFELLRILAIFAITWFHIMAHSVTYQLSTSPITDLLRGPSFSKRLLLYQTVNTFGTTSNAIFILIAGYFLINASKINLTKQIVKIFSQLLFGICFITLSVFAVYFFQNELNNIDVVSKLSNILNMNQSGRIYGSVTLLNINSFCWYLGYYICIIIIAELFLNKWLNKASQSQFLLLVMCMGSLITFCFFINLFNGLSSEHILRLFTGVFFYTTGGYIRKYNPFKNIKAIVFIALIAITYMFLFVSFYNHTMSNIRKFEIGINENFAQSMLGIDNNSILVIIVSISVFELFRRINIGSIKIINFISSATLMIYIIQDYEFVRSFYRMVDWLSLLNNSPLKTLLVLAIFSCLVFLSGFVIYLLYRLAFEIIKKSGKKMVRSADLQD